MTIYISLEQAKTVMKNTLSISGEGDYCEYDIGKLDSVLTHIQNDDYYPTFEKKLTHLVFCTNKFHCFKDGNKRLSIALGEMFLILNGYTFQARYFLNNMENICYHVASDKIDKEFLEEIITACLYEDLDEESLKFKLLKAIGDSSYEV